MITVVRQQIRDYATKNVYIYLPYTISPLSERDNATETQTNDFHFIAVENCNLNLFILIQSLSRKFGKVLALKMK